MFMLDKLKWVEQIKSLKSSSVAPDIRIIDFGALTKPSSSASTPNSIYKLRDVAGISKNASEVTIVLANILLSAISSPLGDTGHTFLFFL